MKAGYSLEKQNFLLAGTVIMKKGITVHMMVKNEEVFVRSAIEAVLPIASEIIVFDTGSTDKTPEIIQSIGSKKIRFFEKGIASPKKLVELRNEMIKMTKTGWFFVVDGDEIFTFSEPEKIIGTLESLSPNVARVEVTIRDFVNDAQLVARDRVSGKFWRTSAIEFSGTYPFEGPVLKKNPSANFASYTSSALASSVVCYHMVFFARSSQDSDVKWGRHWRRIPFPVFPFFGPWPSHFGIDFNAAKTLMKFVFYNVVGFVQVFLHRKEQKRDAFGRGR